MRILAATIIMAVILVSSAFCQVDTLMLVEINSIEIVDDITEFYVEDLNGDEIKEIILCTQYYIYIYDSQTNDLLWTSPLLNNPDNLLFEDINHDGLLDISVHDSLNIYLFDPHNYNTIWISPELDSTYKCYTIGEGNDDGWIDAAIVTKESFTRFGDSENNDTVWIELYDGPLFEISETLIVLMPNYNIEGGHTTYSEVPDRVLIEKIYGNNGLLTKIVIFSFSHDNFHWFGGVWCYSYSGNVWFINPDEYNYHCINSHGVILTHGLSYQEDQRYLYSVSYKSNTDFWGGQYSYTRLKYMNILSYDSLLTREILWEWSDSGSFYNQPPDPLNWNGYVIGEMHSENSIDEICFGAQDSLYLFSFPSLEALWANADILNLDTVLYIYNSSQNFDNPQIICLINDQVNQYQFYSGLDGSLTAILLVNDNIISYVSDLNSDGNDELLSIQGNTLHIYHLDYYVDIDQPETLPYHTFIQPNYPNPFNSSTAIEYGLKQDAHVTLEIYDLLGRKVETLVDVYQPAGMHRAIWNAARISTGIYFYKINAGDFSKTRKMLLLK